MYAHIKIAYRGGGQKWRKCCVRTILDVPLIINCKNKTWGLTKRNIEILPFCNHEESDTHMIFHAGLQTHVVIVAKDSDVLFLLAYTMTLKEGCSRWFQMIDDNQYVNIRIIYDYLDRDISSVLPQFHAITGCNQISYKSNKRKLSTFKKVPNDPSVLRLIQQLGKTKHLPDEVIQNGLFLQTVLFSGICKETYVDTRVRPCTKLKNKSSITIPADPEFMFQEIKRCHLLSFIWLNCLQRVRPQLYPEDYGWYVGINDELHPNLVLQDVNYLPPEGKPK